jgi:hypothetical protein
MHLKPRGFLLCLNHVGHLPLLRHVDVCTVRAARFASTVNLSTEPISCYLCCPIERDRVAKAVTPTRWRYRSQR